MTPKEKAENLYSKFQNEIEFSFADSNRETHILTVMCALIAVDEILQVIEDNSLEYDDNFWDKVKSEIEKL